MTDAASESETEQWVVYSISSLGGVGRFLGVAESKREAREIGDKWWVAFHSGEKAEPDAYAGISWKPVADWDRWKKAEEVR